MRCGHLFNGIGGFALAAHWMGWSNIMHCEIDPFCNQVMNKHFPNSYQHEDIRTTDFTIWRGKLDIITGGFPCQPYSTAGKRKGTADDRHLWPQMLRAIREIQPGWIVGENVRGLTNWNGGLVFDEVQADLEAEGYEVLPFLLPACAVNAPHRRDRIWFVAYANSDGSKRDQKLEKGYKCITGRSAFGEFNSYVSFGVTTNTESIRWDNGTAENERSTTGEKHALGNTAKVCVQQFTTDPNSKQLEGLSVTGINETKGREDAGRQFSKFTHNDWSVWPTQPPVCNRNDGLSFGLVDITFSKWRNESLKALGNAIVPQVAYQIFKGIEQYLACQQPNP